MKISNIIYESIVDGEGLRTVLFISGCWHNCYNCFNKETHDVNNGKDYSISELVELVQNQPLSDVTISGGDGLTFQREETLQLCKDIKEKTSKNIWLYTGYTIEEIKSNKQIKDILNYVDVIVDGKFDENNKDSTLAFRGSSNQRIIKV